MRERQAVSNFGPVWYAGEYLRRGRHDARYVPCNASNDLYKRRGGDDVRDDIATYSANGRRVSRDIG